MTIKDYKAFMEAGEKIVNIFADIDDPAMFQTILAATTHWYELKHGISKADMDTLLDDIRRARDVVHKMREEATI